MYGEINKSPGPVVMRYKPCWFVLEWLIQGVQVRCTPSIIRICNNKPAMLEIIVILTAEPPISSFSIWLSIPLCSSQCPYTLFIPIYTFARITLLLCSVYIIRYMCVFALSVTGPCFIADRGESVVYCLCMLHFGRPHCSVTCICK